MATCCESVLSVPFSPKLVAADRGAGAGDEGQVDVATALARPHCAQHISVESTAIQQLGHSSKLSKSKVPGSCAGGRSSNIAAAVVAADGFCASRGSLVALLSPHWLHSPSLARTTA